MEYPAIEDHGLIGDLQTAALVWHGRHGGLAVPAALDSPSVFGVLLDQRPAASSTSRRPRGEHVRGRCTCRARPSW